MEPNTEVFIKEVFSVKRNETLKVYGTKSGKWCFIKLRGTANFQRKFFFECLLKLTGEVFLRKLTKECQYPPVNPPVPPTEEVCYLHAKKGTKFVSKNIEAYGSKNAEGVITCYLEAIKKTAPTVAVMCTEEALVGEWESITE
jgi:hypothetical protein